MVICTLRRCLSACHISESRHGAGQGRHGRRGTSCGGQAMWAITTNKRTYDQSTPRVLISLSAINIARLLLQLGFPFRSVPSRPVWNLISISISASAFASQAVAACGARPAVRAVNRGSIKSISWRVWCKYKCPTKYNIDYTIARRASQRRARADLRISFLPLSDLK